MSESMRFSTVEAPGLFISRHTADQALKLGISNMRPSRTGVDEVVRRATTSKPLEVGALIVRPRQEVYSATKSGDYFYVDEAGIEEALAGQPISYRKIREQASDLEITTLNVHNQKPTQERLTRGVYAAAARWTREGRSFFTSHNDKVLGGLMATAFAIGVDNFTGQGYTDAETIDDITFVDIAGAPIAGVVLGAAVLAPVLGALRREVDVHAPLVQTDPPIEVHYS